MNNESTPGRAGHSGAHATGMGAVSPLHQPEHPLPWRIPDGEHRETVSVCSVPRRACVASCEEYDDAAYIVHACNAYPRLVAMLKGLRDNLDVDPLLRELGEIE